MVIGDRIRDLRWEHRLTASELSRRAGIAKNTLSRIELGKVEPTIHTLEKIASSLGIEVGELLQVEEPAFAGKAEAPREAGDPDLEWLPGYLRFLKQQTESMRTRWETAIKENTVEPGAWYEAADVAMDLGKRFVETIPPPLYATEDRGPLREEWGETVADALGGLMMLRTTLEVAYHACERRFEEKGDLDDVAEDLDRDDVEEEALDRDDEVDQLLWLREQHRRLREEVPEPLKAALAA